MNPRIIKVDNRATVAWIVSWREPNLHGSVIAAVREAEKILRDEFPSIKEVRHVQLPDQGTGPRGYVTVILN